MDVPGLDGNDAALRDQGAVVKTELAAGGLQVSIDHDRCSGTGYCQEGLPALFTVQDRRAWLREDFDLASADREDVEDTAGTCPWFAITVEER